ncbi:MAG: recombinase XerD [Deltaproteobacteria bacterium]|nr:MAG: recombinase XerD [Deltaproteobacteria bacterium]
MTGLLKQYKKDFLSELEFGKNYSSHTLKSYNSDLLYFFFFLEKNYPGISPENIDKNILRSYLSVLYQEKFKISTIKRKIAALRSFFNFLLKKDIIQRNAVMDIVSPKSEKAIPSFINIDDMFLFLDSIKDKSWLDLRNRAIFELMYSTGMRVSELVSLNMESIDWEGYVRIMGKGSRERIVPAGKRALERVNKYIKKLETDFFLDINQGPLFLNKYKKRISDRSIRRILDKLIGEAGLFLKISPHKIRHSFATHMLDNGADLRFIQEFLNHKSLSTTQKYTHVTMDRLMAVYDNAHPRN